MSHVPSDGRSVQLTRQLLLATVLIVLTCASLPLPTHALFTEVYPYVKTAVTVDRAGTVYFNHANTNEIHAQVVSNKMNFAYTVDASLSRPSGLAADTDGSLLIADTGNHRIVRLNTTTGETTAIYITTNPALQWPCDVAADSSDGSMLVADTWNHRIVRLSARGEQLVYHTTSPSLHYPAGVSLDSAGRVFIADTGNDRIVQMSAAGAVMEVYRTSSPSLSAPLAVVVDADGNLLIADSGNDRVVKVSAAGTQLMVYGTAIQSPMSYPSDVALDAADMLYVADSGNNRVVRMRTMVWGLKYETHMPSLSNPTGVAVDARSDTYVIVDWGNRWLVRINQKHEQLAAYAPPLQAGSRVAMHALTGAMYVTDSLAGVVVELSLNGTLLPSYNTTAVSLSSPQGMVLNAAGELFVADSGNDRVVLLSAMGAILRVYTTSSPALREPLDVAVDSVGCRYVVDSGNNRVIKLNVADGRELFVFTTCKPALNRPSGVAVRTAGGLWIVDTGNNRIVKLYADGTLQASYGNSSTMPYPTAVALDGHGSALLCDGVPDHITRLDINAVSWEEFYSPTVSQLPRPSAVTVAPDGTLYVVNKPDRILRRSPNSLLITVYTVTGETLTSIVVDDSGQYLYAGLLFPTRHGILRLDTRAGEQTALFNSTKPFLNVPSGFPLDSDSIYVADFTMDV